MIHTAENLPQYVMENVSTESMPIFLALAEFYEVGTITPEETEELLQEFGGWRLFEEVTTFDALGHCDYAFDLLTGTHEADVTDFEQYGRGVHREYGGTFVSQGYLFPI